MKLQEIFDQLTYGELSQISIGGGEMGVIDPSNYARIVAHINLGLTALHKRFLLKKREFILQLQTGQTDYPLISSFAVNARKSRETIRFILDSVTSPFTDDILKVEEVWTEDDYELSLNDAADPYSVTTPKYNMLRVPLDIVNQSMDISDSLKTTNLEVVYRANHSLVSPNNPNVEIDLPYSHLEPLLLFIASRVHTPIGMVNEFNAGNNYAKKYEMACQALEIQNLQVDQGAQSNRLDQNGWV